MQFVRLEIENCASYSDVELYIFYWRSKSAFLVLSWNGSMKNLKFRFGIYSRRCENMNFYLYMINNWGVTFDCSVARWKYLILRKNVYVHRFASEIFEYFVWIDCVTKFKQTDSRNMTVCTRKGVVASIYSFIKRMSKQNFLFKQNLLLLQFLLQIYLTLECYTGSLLLGCANCW